MTATYRPYDIARLWAKIDRRGPDDCWPWQGTPTKKGYGQIAVRGRSIRAHRMAFEVVHGPVPPHIDVCHTCDNPPCCNPAHLFDGTKADNQRDKRLKGRATKGIRNPGGGRLSEADVRDIRVLAAEDGLSKTEIGRRFGVTRQMVGHIVSGRQWAHVQ